MKQWKNTARPDKLPHSFDGVHAALHKSAILCVVQVI